MDLLKPWFIPILAQLNLVLGWVGDTLAWATKEAPDTLTHRPFFIFFMGQRRITTPSKKKLQLMRGSHAISFPRSTPTQFIRDI